MCRITYLKLVNYNRFPLRELEIFEHQFNSKLLVISGLNGAGKSSLMGELTPLPADKNNFKKGGYKEIHITHRGDSYVLISDFTNGITFNFICNGEELNPAGNVTPQKDLVLRHFNISPVVQDILVGAESFTSMSLPARKKLFDTITHMNIDKVLEGYNSLKDELKTNELLLKTRISSYQIEEQKFLGETELERLKLDLIKVKESVDTLFGIRSELQRYNTSQDTADIHINLKSQLDKLKQIYVTNYTAITAYPKGDLGKYKTKYTSELAILEHRIKQLYSALEELHSEHNKHLKSGELDKDSLLEEQRRLSVEIQTKLDSTTILKTKPVNLEEVHNAIYLLETSLPEILRAIPINLDIDGRKIYTKERYDTLVEVTNKLRDKIQTIVAEELSITHRLENTHDIQGNVQCPVCSHSWSISDAIKSSPDLRERLAHLGKVKLDTNKHLQDSIVETEEVMEYFRMYSQYRNLKKQTLDTLTVFWGKIDESGYIFSDPTSILTILSTINLDANLHTEVEYLRKELSTVNTKLETLVNTSTMRVEEITTRIDTLNSTTIRLQEERVELLSTLDTLRYLENLYRQIEALESLIEATKSKVKTHNLSKLVDDLTEVIDDELRSKRISLLNLEKEITQSTSVQHTLEHLNREIDETKENIYLLNLLITELSPKSGLIAKSISSFLNTIITNINNTIARIWDYKMVLKPIDMETDSLNYRFKLEVEDRLTVEDISKSSLGMKEIINLSFKLIMYKLLKLENYPLYMDELGSHLDRTHLTNLMSIVQGMVTSDKFSQIFVISHKDDFSFIREIETVEL